MKKITEFEIVSHGIDGEQYFPGCGVACTSFDDVATGIGDTEQEAFRIASTLWSITDFIPATAAEQRRTSSKDFSPA